MAHFFDEGAASNTDWAEAVAPTLVIGFRATAFMITVDSAGPLEFSFDGRTRHGKVLFDERFISLDNVDVSRVWLRSPSGAPTTWRVFAWEMQR